MAGLKNFARSENIRAARFTAIGAFQSATLAYFDWEKKDYVEIPVTEQVEVLVLAGDIAWDGGMDRRLVGICDAPSFGPRSS